MNSTLWRYSWRNTKRRPLRATLTLAGIMIGVATVVAVSVMTHTMRGVYQRTFEKLIGNASVEVLADGLTGFDEGLVRRIEQLPEVEAAVGVIQTGCGMMTQSGPVPLMLLAIDPDRDGRVRDYEVLQGEMLLTESPGILIGQHLSESHGLSVGDHLRLVGPTGLMTWPIYGILRSTGAAQFNGGAIGFVSLRQAQRRLRMEGKVNGIHLVLRDSSNRIAAQSKVNEILPEGIHAQTTHGRSELGMDAIANLEMILSVLGVVSLAAGAFVVLNTFRMNLEERRRQLAVLRALGATKPQVTRLLLREALLYGAVGTILGIAMGLALALAMRPAVGAMFGAAAPSLVITVEPILLALLLGPAATILATYIPARRASRRFVLADLLTRREIGGTSERVWARYVGLLSLAIAALITATFHFGWLQPGKARGLLPIAMVCLITGVVFSLPWVLGPIQNWVHWSVGRLFGVEGRLAVRELDRNPSRTSTTIGVLVVAILVSVGPGNEVTGAIDHLYRWFDKLAIVDYFVTGSLGDVGFSLTPVTLPESTAEEISKLPSIERVKATNFLVSRVRNKMVVTLADEHSEDTPTTLSFARDSPPEAAARLARGEGVVVGTGLAQRLKLDVGDEIEIATTMKSAKLPIVGKVLDYYVGGMTVHIDRDLARQYFDLDGAHSFGVASVDGLSQQAATELKSFCDERGLLLFSFAELKTDLRSRMQDTFGFLWGMMGLVFLVASLAIVNMLAMNVLDQIRELGVLRAIGMQRWQVQKMVLIQALTIGLVSLLPGVAAGIATALAMNLPAESLTGRAVPFVIQPRIIAMAVITAMVVTLIAAWFPARYATRLSIVKAVKYE